MRTGFGPHNSHVVLLWFQVCPSTAVWRRTARMWPTLTRSVFISSHSLNKRGISNHLFTFIRSHDPRLALRLSVAEPAAQSIFTESLCEWQSHLFLPIGINWWRTATCVISLKYDSADIGPCFQRARTGFTREGEEAVKPQSSVCSCSQRCNGGCEVKETISNGMEADSGAN